MSDTYKDGQISYCQGFANRAAVLSLGALVASVWASNCIDGANPTVSYVVFGGITAAMVVAPTVIERVTGRGR